MLEFLYIGVTHNSSASMTNNLLRHRMPRVSFQQRREKQALFFRHVNQNFFLHHSTDWQGKVSERLVWLVPNLSSEVWNFCVTWHGRHARIGCSDGWKARRGCCRMQPFPERGLGRCRQLQESVEFPWIEVLNETWSDSQVHSLLLLSLSVFLQVGWGGGCTPRLSLNQHVLHVSPAMIFPNSLRPRVRGGDAIRMLRQRTHSIFLLRLTDVLIWDLLGGTMHPVYGTDLEKHTHRHNLLEA